MWNVWCNSGSPSMVPAPAAWTSPGNLLEMQILRPNPRYPESETLRVGPSDPYFNKSSRWPRGMLKLEKCCCIIIGLSMLKIIAFHYCCYELLPGVQNTQSLLRWTVVLENQGVECDIAKQLVCVFDDEKSRNIKIREMDACRMGMTWQRWAWRMNRLKRQMDLSRAFWLRKQQ